MGLGRRPVETVPDQGINIGYLAHKEQQEQHRGEGEFQFF